MQMGRSAGFSLGGTYSSHRAQQQQHAPSVSSGNVSFSSVNQDILHLHGSDIFPSSHSTYHSQVQVLFINGGACFIMNKPLFPPLFCLSLEMTCFPLKQLLPSADILIAFVFWFRPVDLLVLD